MAVQAFGEQFGGDGHGDSIAAFMRSHVENTEALLNLAEGVKKNQPRPTYNPANPDNLWPFMLHHPAKGELAVGQSVKGIADPMARSRILKDNEQKRAELLKLGYRLEPFVKPQVPVLDAASEKAALLRRNNELEGLITQQHDALLRMEQRLQTVEKGQ